MCESLRDHKNKLYTLVAAGAASVALSGCVGCVVETGQSLNNQVQEGLEPSLEGPEIQLPDANTPQ